ncbi:hypothetical protein DSO57_1033130 [Entomophthora muscae]|uniref:Uncharacterized protein n=1 Tax=Entomophthora muscae TaxID=34485 RepID=A0ACC2UKA8_9FUNG|nr:hypothetical protein DSO57_1033130 [Entomophthora muscae]
MSLKTRSNIILRDLKFPGRISIFPSLSLKPQRNIQRYLQTSHKLFEQNLGDSKELDNSYSKWAKPTRKISITISDDDMKKLRLTCGAPSQFAMLSKLPTTATPRDVFQFNRTNDDFYEVLQDYFFERTPSYEFSGTVYLKFSEEKAAAQFCFDAINSGALSGGHVISPKFVEEAKFQKARSLSLTQEMGAGTSVYITGLPGLTTAADIRGWIEPHLNPLIIDGSLALKIRPINISRLNTTQIRNLKLTKDSNRLDAPSSSFLVDVKTESDAYLLASRLHITPFKPFIYGERYLPSVVMAY